MNNNKENSLEWYIVKRHDLEINSRLGEIEPVQYGEELLKLEQQAREMYRDEIEAASIISSVEQSTSAASQKTEAFAIGYEQGYNRALELSKWAISNLIPPHNHKK